MELHITAEGQFVIRKIPAVIAEILRRITRWTDYDSERAEARLFPAPTEDCAEDELRADWKAHVQPGLYSHFHAAREIVDADLRRMEKSAGVFNLTIPSAHADAWINGLNQARLAIVSEMEFTDEELGAARPADVTGDRDFALFQIDFYAHIQQWMIEQIEGP